MKRFIKVFISLFMILSIICLQTFGVSAYSGKRISSDGFYYRVLNDNCAEILGYDDVTNYMIESVFEIPAEVDGYKVTSIGDDSFEYWDDGMPDKIIIPDTVTYIGDSAFSADTFIAWDRSTIKEFVIPSSVTYIGDGAFYGNIHVESIDIPDSVAHIGDYAFSECWALKEVEIPGAVEYLGKNLFDRCKSLEKVTIGNGVKEIGEKTFYDCPELKSVTAYENVSFGDKAIGYSYNKKTKKEILNKKVKINVLESGSSPINNGPVAYAENQDLQYTFYLTKAETKTLQAMAGNICKFKIKDEKAIKWNSSNKNVASINNNGKTRALSKGTTTLTATLSDGTEYSRDFKVTTSPNLHRVKRDDKGEASVFLNPIKKITLKKGKTKEIKIEGKIAGIKNVYTSTKYAKIIGNTKSNYFKVQGLKKGTTTLTIKVNGVKDLKLKIKVK